jgi:hypothetical protein
MEYIVDDSCELPEYIKNMSSEECQRLIIQLEKMPAEEADIIGARLEREYNERKRKQQKRKSVTA